MTQPWDIYEISQNNPYLSQGSGFQMLDISCLPGSCPGSASASVAPGR